MLLVVDDLIEFNRFCVKFDMYFGRLSIRFSDKLKFMGTTIKAKLKTLIFIKTSSNSFNQ